MEMRVHVLVLTFCICQLCSAQFGPIDFEPAGHGSTWQWTTFENDFNPLLEIIANPDPSGINTPNTVARFTANAPSCFPIPWIFQQNRQAFI